MTATYDPRADWSREDAERLVEAVRPPLKTLVQIPHEVWGYHDEHTHASVVELQHCELAAHAYLDAQVEAECAAEAAYERWLENRGWEEALAERAWEDSRGVVQFEDAWDLAGR